MTDLSANNKRIAKNTAFLYIRMFLIMAITFYTSRVILETLGAEDYGLYNVIGGIIAMFGLINSSMSTATQRFLTFETGRNDTVRMRKIFSVSLIIHLLIAIIIIILGETVGLWFFWHKMNIPEVRLDAAMWVYQMSILSAVIMIISVPYNAAIIAHEKMNAFAYISILDVSLRLLSVYILLLFEIDKLKLYAVLMLLTQLLLRIIYGLYCKKNFVETHGRMYWDHSLFKEMLSFASWAIWGNCASLFCTQGLNILLNIFFSPTVNAARALAVQVQNGISLFSSNLQSAINPQITKSYATGNFAYMHQLIYYSSKLSFLLLWIIILPIFLNTDAILHIWLKEVPEHSSTFIRIILITMLIEVLSNPFSTTVSATGKIRTYQTIIGGIMMTTLPASYIVLKLGALPESVFNVSLCVSFISYLVRFYFIQKYVNIDTINYLHKVIFKLIPTLIISSIMGYMLSHIFTESTIAVIISSSIYIIISSITAYLIGLEKEEKQFIRNKIFFKLKLIRHD